MCYNQIRKFNSIINVFNGRIDFYLVVPNLFCIKVVTRGIKEKWVKKLHLRSISSQQPTYPIPIVIPSKTKLTIASVLVAFGITHTRNVSFEPNENYDICYLQFHNYDKLSVAFLSWKLVSSSLWFVHHNLDDNSCEVSIW